MPALISGFLHAYTLPTGRFGRVFLIAFIAARW